MLAREAGTTEEATMSANDEGEGKGPDLKSAAEAAWENAKGKGNDKGWYEIKKIDVRTENPIREYRVTIKKIPGGQ